MMSLFWVDGLISWAPRDFIVGKRKRKRGGGAPEHKYEVGVLYRIPRKKVSLAQLVERPPSSGESNPPRRATKCTERGVVQKKRFVVFRAQSQITTIDTKKRHQKNPIENLDILCLF